LKRRGEVDQIIPVLPEEDSGRVVEAGQAIPSLSRHPSLKKGGEK
jgi:hypothetical protein